MSRGFAVRQHARFSSLLWESDSIDLPELAQSDSDNERQGYGDKKRD